MNSFADSPNPSPTQQPAAREGNFSGELHAEKQLDITARAAARLQRESRATDHESISSTRRFHSATTEGDPDTVRTLNKATVGMHYLRPIKKPASLAAHVPPCFEKLRCELHRVRFSYVSPLPSQAQLNRQRAQR